MRRSLNLFFWLLFFFLLTILFGGAGYFIHERSAPARVTIEKEMLTGSREPIVLHFSQPMRKESLSEKIHFSEALPASMSWGKSNTELMLTPRTEWPIAASFTLSIGQGQTAYFAETAPVNFSLSTKEAPKIRSISPAPGSHDVSLDIEDPIRIIFDQSTEDFYIDFRIDSTVAEANQINPEKTVFEVLPRNKLLPAKEYAFDIYAKWKDGNDNSYVLLSHSTFTTLSPPPSARNDNFSTRIEEAKKFTRAQKTTGKYIDINLRSQVMTIFENGNALDAYIISSGKRGLETPKGEFAIQNKADRPWSKKYGLYMPYWMAIVPSGLFGIHELPEWPSGYKEGENHLGIPVSHGCVRLGVGPAERVFEWADIGTPVIIY